MSLIKFLKRRMTAKALTPDSPFSQEETEWHLRELEQQGLVYKDKQGRWWPTQKVH